MCIIDETSFRTTYYRMLLFTNMIQQLVKAGKTGTPTTHTHSPDNHHPRTSPAPPHTLRNPRKYRPWTCHHPSSRPTSPTDTGTARTTRVRVRAVLAVFGRVTTPARSPGAPDPPRDDPPGPPHTAHRAVHQEPPTTTTQHRRRDTPGGSARLLLPRHPDALPRGPALRAVHIGDRRDGNTSPLEGCQEKPPPLAVIERKV